MFHARETRTRDEMKPNLHFWHHQDIQFIFYFLIYIEEHKKGLFCPHHTELASVLERIVHIQLFSDN